MSAPPVAASTFVADVRELESAWQRAPAGDLDLPILDCGPATGDPVVFVPILEHLEFGYARQIHALSQTRRVILYRWRASRTRPVGLVERAEELRHVLDEL